MKKILFYSHVKDISLFSTVAYYEQDILALNALGFEVQATNRLRDLFFGKYDVLYVWWWTYSIFAVTAARIKGVKLLIAGAFHYRTPLMGGTDFVRRSKIYKFLVRIGLYFADANLFISKVEYEDVKLNLPVRNPYIVSCVVDTEKYQAKKIKVPPNVSKNKTLHLTVISWLEKYNMERKRIFELMDVIKSLVEKGLKVKFNVIGRPGLGYEDLLHHVESLKIADYVCFHGNISEDKKVKILQETDVYLAPTLYEGFGLAVAEAMACECAVITSANGAIIEVVAETGIYTDPMSIEDMSSKVYQLLKNEKKRKHLGKLARKHIIENFNFEKKKGDLFKIFQDLKIV